RDRRPPITAMRRPRPGQVNQACTGSASSPAGAGGRSPGRTVTGGRTDVPAFRATYRLQLGADLTFEGAAALVPYLRDLGVSHLYLSPACAARAGSTHGYDVIDPARFSDALGGEDGFRALAAAASDA